jgi:hypothetical protein
VRFPLDFGNKTKDEIFLFFKDKVFYFSVLDSFEEGHIMMRKIEVFSFIKMDNFIYRFYHQNHEKTSRYPNTFWNGCMLLTQFVHCLFRDRGGEISCLTNILSRHVSL